MSDIRKAIMERLGAVVEGTKATFAKFNKGDTVVVPYGREMVRGKIVRYDAPGMFYVVDIGKYESIKVAKEDVRKASMSRPGVKATFDSSQVAFFLDALASQVIDQKDLAKKNAQSAADYVFKHGTDAQIKRFVQLAERVGLRVNMARPGAKAEMGMRDTKGRGPFTLQYIASGLYGEPTWLLVDKAGKTVAKEHNEQSAKEMLRKANAGEPVYVSSRPGAKAKMAKPVVGETYVIVVRNEDEYGSQSFTGRAKAVRTIGNNYRVLLEDASTDGGNTVHRVEIDEADIYSIRKFSRPGAKATAAKPDETEREDVKAGLKLMEKADQAVSDKIRTLIKEGKPQDQAVAIALDMKRRGEL